MEPVPTLCVRPQGDSVTRGLKKVTDDMKAKNRADRTGTVSASTSNGHISLVHAPKILTFHMTAFNELGLAYDAFTFIAILTESWKAVSVASGLNSPSRGQVVVGQWVY